jgi:hypothetical protein
MLMSRDFQDATEFVLVDDGCGTSTDGVVVRQLRLAIEAAEKSEAKKVSDSQMTAPGQNQHETGTSPRRRRS